MARKIQAAEVDRKGAAGALLSVESGTVRMAGRASFDSADQLYARWPKAHVSLSSHAVTYLLLSLPPAEEPQLARAAARRLEEELPIGRVRGVGLVDMGRTALIATCPGTISTIFP